MARGLYPEFDASKNAWLTYHDENITGVLVGNLTPEKQNWIVFEWKDKISREILLFLSEEWLSHHVISSTSTNGEESFTRKSKRPAINILKIKEKIGHSYSLIRKKIEKLEREGLVELVMSYERKKQRLVRPLFLFADTREEKNQTLFGGKMLSLSRGQLLKIKKILNEAPQDEEELLKKLPEIPSEELRRYLRTSEKVKRKYYAED